MNFDIKLITIYKFKNSANCIAFYLYATKFDAYDDGVPFSSSDVFGKLIYRDKQNFQSQSFFKLTELELIEAMKSWCADMNFGSPEFFEFHPEHKPIIGEETDA